MAQLALPKIREGKTHLQTANIKFPTTNMNDSKKKKKTTHTLEESLLLTLGIEMSRELPTSITDD